MMQICSDKHRQHRDKANSLLAVAQAQFHKEWAWQSDRIGENFTEVDADTALPSLCNVKSKLDEALDLVLELSLSLEHAVAIMLLMLMLVICLPVCLSVCPSAVAML
ncbi:hypothetical protein ACLKA6_007280 [Drosophila palustris]